MSRKKKKFIGKDGLEYDRGATWVGLYPRRTKSKIEKIRHDETKHKKEYKDKSEE